MAILETFYYLFKSDAEALDSGLAESEKRAEQTADAVGKADNAASSLGESFKSVAMQAGAVLAAFASVGAIIEGVKAATEFNDKLGETAEALDINVEELSAWSDAAQMSGGSAEAFQGTLKSMTAAMAQVDTTGKSRLKPFFDELGVSMLDSAGKARPVMDMLPELAEKFQHLSKSEAFGMGQKLGLDQGTVMMLQRGGAELDALIRRQKELGVTTAEDAEIAGDFNDALDDTKHAMRTVYTSIASIILPGLTMLNRGLQFVITWARQNEKFVTGFFMAIGAAIAVYYLPPIISAAAATLVAIAPFLLIGAAIAAAAAAFALIYDDIMTFLEGGDSVTGRLLEWVNSFGLVRAAIDFVKALFGYLSNEIAAFLENSTAVQAGIDIMTMAFEGLKSVLDTIIEAFSWIMEKGAALGGIISSVTGALGDKISGALQAGTAALQSAGGAPLAAQTSASIGAQNTSNRTNNVNVGKVTVNTKATDSAGISKSVGGALQKQMRQAVANYDDGVAG